VIHAAGQFRFWGDSPSFWRTNVGGTSALLAAATAVSVKRFIHISTIVVIGQTAERGALEETTPCYPLEPYQRTKYEAEQLALSYHREQGLPVIVLRPGAFYGPTAVMPSTASSSRNPCAAGASRWKAATASPSPPTCQMWCRA
jgi:2-alkyl-3-oxoalkanoate reductase